MGAEGAQVLYEQGLLTFEAAIFKGDEILMTDGFAPDFELADDRYQTVLLSERY
jgi:hypothetical protein